MDHPLVGGQVQRVHVARLAGRDVALLKIRVPPRRSLDLAGMNVQVVAAAGLGVGLVADGGSSSLRSMMQSATAAAQSQWRARLEGAHVTNVGEWAFAVAREGKRWYANAQNGPDLILVGHADGDDDGALAHPATYEATAAEMSQDRMHALAERGQRIAAELAGGELALRRHALRRALTKAIARLDRRIDAVRGDLARMDLAIATGERARLFVAEAARAPRGATKLEAVDWSSGEAVAIEMVIDPARTAQEQIDASFKRARRLKDGTNFASARLLDVEKARFALAAISDALAALQDAGRSMVLRHPSPDEGALADLEAGARAAAPRDFRLGPASAPRQQSKASAPVARPPFRTFASASDARILVGRGAAHNDALTFRVSRPHDLWLHAKGHTGAHVIVPLDKGRSCPGDVLIEAAHLAAHFSSARDESVVEVEYTSRRYVRKPRGSAPGLVVVDREKVLILRHEEALLRKLLERESGD